MLYNVNTKIDPSPYKTLLTKDGQQIPLIALNKTVNILPENNNNIKIYLPEVKETHDGSILKIKNLSENNNFFLYINQNSNYLIDSNTYILIPRMSEVLLSFSYRENYYIGWKVIGGIPLINNIIIDIDNSFRLDELFKSLPNLDKKPSGSTLTINFSDGEYNIPYSPRLSNKNIRILLNGNNSDESAVKLKFNQTYFSGKLKNSYSASTTYTSIVMYNITKNAPYNNILSTGVLRLINSSNEEEIINYTSYTYDSGTGEYTFSINHTFSYDFDIDDNGYGLVDTNLSFINCLEVDLNWLSLYFNPYSQWTGIYSKYCNYLSLYKIILKNSYGDNFNGRNDYNGFFISLGNFSVKYIDYYGFKYALEIFGASGNFEYMDCHGTEPYYLAYVNKVGQINFCSDPSANFSNKRLQILHGGTIVKYDGTIINSEGTYTY